MCRGFGLSKRINSTPGILPVASIAGTAAKLTIAPFCKLGGYLVDIGSWSRDGGSGPDDCWSW
jgi:hypothetical protein